MKEEHKNYIISIVVLFCTISYAQNNISGYVDIEKPEDEEQKVYLSQINFGESTNEQSEIVIASTPILENGFFAFDQNLFKPQNHIYKIHLNPLSTQEKKILSDKVKHFKLFILSKKDTIHFNKGSQPFNDYTTNNKAEQEWQKLKKFEAKYENLTGDFDTRQYLLETKGYVKDSLQILLVKLIGIKKLDDQDLLEKDIKANPKYYSDFLQELKSSEIDPNFYLYLEHKLTLVTKDITTQKYNLSLWANGFTIFIISLLIFYIIKYKDKVKNTSIPPSLSKQEEKIKDLIISGKSNKEIANELFISLSTVKTHITNIYSKLNIGTRKELLLKK